MIRLATMLLLIGAGPALADPGHLAASGGHDHWIAAVALGAAAVAALWGALKARAEAAEAAETEDAGDEDAADDAAQEA